MSIKLETGDVERCEAAAAAEHAQDQYTALQHICLYCGQLTTHCTCSPASLQKMHETELAFRQHAKGQINTLEMRVRDLELSSEELSRRVVELERGYIELQRSFSNYTISMLPVTTKGE